MRRCKVAFTAFDPKVSDYKTVIIKGYFHGWGSITSGDGPETVAIFEEAKTRQVKLIDPNRVTFSEDPEPENFIDKLRPPTKEGIDDGLSHSSTINKPL